MKSVIVGTAGHIDHGKTALVKALTGIDADRLDEEKRRGITIDIGFAHLELPRPAATLRLGFVDVPGHERFVRNMLAGVGGIDLVLLVIAADEGVMPQTREHFDICRLLSACRRGIVGAHQVRPRRRRTRSTWSRLEVEDFLRGHSSILARADRPGQFAHRRRASTTCKRALADVAAEVPASDSAEPGPPAHRPRLHHERLRHGGHRHADLRKHPERSRTRSFPQGKRVRVRGIQVHGASSEQAVAGQRTALNLAGATTEDLARGMTLAPPATFNATARVDVALSLLASAKPLKDRARVHFHAYTSETIATVVLYGKKQVAPGETAFAQLRLSDPTLLLPGDRFIIRRFSPVITIGGGVVVENAPPAKGARCCRPATYLSSLLGGNQADACERESPWPAPAV